MTLSCRFCGASLHDTLIHLGLPTPVRVVRRTGGRRADGAGPSASSPICRECRLVQLPALVDREEIFRGGACYDGFWVPLDTLNGLEALQRVEESCAAPWAVWRTHHGGAAANDRS